MIGCNCGDLYCRSCGPAQGNGYCPHCKSWAADGGCADPRACGEAERQHTEALAQLMLSDEDFDLRDCWEEKRNGQNGC